jgi:hypothetical protein
MRTQMARKISIGIGLAAAVVSLAAIPGASSAHHSFAMFDANKEVILDGVVREYQWQNPHTWTQITVTENGAAVEYAVEGAGSSSLTRRGRTRRDIKAGDHIKLTIHPLKDGTKGGSFVKAVFPDGKVLAESQGG